MRRYLIIAVVIVAIYFAYRWAGSHGQSYGAIRVIYDKIGQARDAMGVPFNTQNPGR